MWVLALGGLSLAVAQACIFCRLPAHDLPGRLARLSSQMEVQWKEWTSPDFSAFALAIASVHSPLWTHWTLPLGELWILGKQKRPQNFLLGWVENHCSLPISTDEVTMNKVTEKTHRVLRVMEIKGSFSSLLLFWQWLQKTKIPQYTREALCAPACRGSTILYNCSTCLGTEMSCWPRKRCLPGSHDLWETRILLLSIFGAVLLLGVLSLQVESRHLQAKGDL